MPVVPRWPISSQLLLYHGTQEDVTHNENIYISDFDYKKIYIDNRSKIFDILDNRHTDFAKLREFMLMKSRLTYIVEFYLVALNWSNDHLTNASK